MKTLKKGWRRFAFKVVPKAFNIFIILGLIFQPVGPAGVASIAWAIESDAAVVVTADEPEAKPAPIEEEKEAPAAAEEELAPVADEETAPAVTEEEPAGSAEAVPVPEATETETDEPVVDAPETLPATEEVPAVEETAPAVPTDPAEVPATEPVEEGAPAPEAPVVEGSTDEERAAPTEAAPVLASVPETIASAAESESAPTQVCLGDEGAATGSFSPAWNIDEAAGTAETVGEVALGTEYVFPLDKDVRITFTCLPSDLSDRAPLRIERVKTADIDLPQGMVAVSEYAYDVTTDGMENGDFRYDLSLPKSDAIGAEVRYIERSAEEVTADAVTESDLKTVDEKQVEEKSDSLEVSELDHFTIFIVTTASDAPKLSAGAVNNKTQVTVLPNTNITVTLKATTSGSNSADDWNSSQYKIGNGAWICVDTVNHNGDNTYQESFTIVAPAAVGTYPLALKVYNSSDCTSGASSEYVMVDAIVVAPPVSNPSLSRACGLDIALVIDNSTSISTTELNQMKSAMAGFTSALTGTPTQFSVTRFATTGAVAQAFTGNIANVNSAISGIPVGGGSTNWQDGLTKAKSTLPNRSNPDLVIFASDGNPNRTGTSGTTVVESVAVNDAVAVANTIKSGGARVIALGIGNDLNVDNLKAISGPTVGTNLSADVITSDFSTLASTLAAFASETCGGTITVKKMVGQDPASGWTFMINGEAYVTDANGLTEAVDVDPDTYTVTETPQAGYSLASASCTGATNNGQQGVNSVSGIVVGNSNIVACTFNNTRVPMCGDGAVNGQEQCDAGAQNGTACVPGYGQNCNYCSAQCTTATVNGPYCGDGIKNGAEACDGTDGVPSAEFACTKSCSLELVNPKVSICHATASQSNPYIANEPNKSADVAGHDNHNGSVWFPGIAVTWGDIIPPFQYVGGSYPGQNWTLEGQAIWNNQCTVPFGSVKVDKRTDSNGDGDYSDTGEGVNGSASNIFKWTLDGAGSNAFGATVNAVAAGAHTVNETGPVGYHFAGWFPTGSTQYSCANPKGTVLPVEAMVVSEQIASITLCNVRDTGKITIVKDAIDNSPQDFNFTTTGNLGSFTLDDDGNNSTNNGGRSNTKVFTVVGTGAYLVTESVVSGWKLTDLVCTGDQNGIMNKDTRTATINLEAGEEVTCTFTNTKLGTIEGYKFDDRDGDGRRDEHESKLNGWKIFIDQNENSRFDDGELSDVTSGNFWVFNLGAYSFENLLPGTYRICEETQDDWYNSTPLCQTVVLASGEEKAVNFGNHQAVKVVASKIMCADESELPNWGAHGGPNITAATAQLWVNTHRSCELVPDWKFQWSYDGIPNPGDNNMSDSVTGWTTFGPTSATGVTETMIADLKGDQKIWVRELPQTGYLPFSGYPNVNPVSAEMYCHTDAINYDNWEWISDPQYGRTYYCVAWNVKLGSINGEKWNDRDADGVRDEGEELLGGWTIYLDLNNDGDRDENEPSDVTDEDDGSFSFAGLVPGHYVVREEMREGWQQTANRCVVKEEESEEEDSEENQNARFFRPKPESRPGTEVKPGDAVRCLIGNTELPSLSIEKWNDSMGVEQPGNTVRYHIKVTAHDNDVLGVKVTDLPPAGFTYVSGSAVADQGSLSHVYASPGIWDLGDMTAGQSIELVYDTTISGTQDAGDYKDLAYARGTSESEAVVLADDLLDADNFVGTNVEVALAEISETVVVPEDKEHKIKEKTVRKTKVLGASTVLPMTGAHTGFLALSLAALISGIALLVLARRSRKSFIASEPMLKSLAFILVSATCLAVGPAVWAAESGLVSAQIEIPAAVTTTPDFKIGFVALDIASPARLLEVQCFKTGDATAFDTHTLAVGGSSGDCQVSAAVMPADGDYGFYIKVVTMSGADESVISGTVNVKLVGTIPGTPYDYDRHDASCMNTITFTTASDAGKTVKVELYRSLATTFVADAATKVAEQAIGSGVSGSFSVAAPGCSNDSFYALRAVDAYGHGSAFVGDADRDVDTDTVTHTKTKTVDGSSTSQGAIPVTGTGAAGAGEVEGAETTADEAGQAGSVLGESVEAEENADDQSGFMSAHPWLSGFGALILLVLGYILYTRKQHDEEQQ